MKGQGAQLSLEGPDEACWENREQGEGGRTQRAQWGGGRGPGCELVPWKQTEGGGAKGGQEEGAGSAEASPPPQSQGRTGMIFHYPAAQG